MRRHLEQIDVSRLGRHDYVGISKRPKDPNFLLVAPFRSLSEERPPGYIIAECDREWLVAILDIAERTEAWLVPQVNLSAILAPDERPPIKGPEVPPDSEQETSAF